MTHTNDAHDPTADAVEASKDAARAAFARRQPAPHADRDHSEEQLTTSMFDNFIHPCLDCGTTIRVVNGQRQPHECQTFGEQDSQVAYAWWQGYDAAKASQTPAPSSDVRSSHVVGDGPSIVGMVDSFGRPATVFTPPEDLRRDPARWPTPEEFVTEWERYTPDQRLQLAERILADGQAVADCTIHLMKRREVEAERDALRAEVERLNESTGEVWREMNEHINDATDRAETAEAALAEERAKVERLKVQNRKLVNGILPLQAECPAPGGCGNCALCHRDIARDCIRLANKRLRDAGRRPMPEGLWDVLTLAARAEAAEAIVARVEALAEEWEEATVWPDEPHRQLRGAAARLRIALSGDAP